MGLLFAAEGDVQDWRHDFRWEWCTVRRNVLRGRRRQLERVTGARYQSDAAATTTTMTRVSTVDFDFPDTVATALRTCSQSDQRWSVAQRTCYNNDRCTRIDCVPK